MHDKPILFSVLDLAPITQGSTAAVSLRNSLDLAQRAEALGYHRYWFAEHHSLAGIASAATSVVIGYVAGGTRTIRVGSGGIMLPNHAPLVIAEQFGTLESLYPGRIDLGVGRAPGSDVQTSRALRRGLGSSGDTFPQDLQELRSYFAAPVPGQPVHAIPGEGLQVPIYLLGSSTFSAQLAGHLGLPFAFASHFAPTYLMPALQLYRAGFTPSESLAAPHVIVGVGVCAADTDFEARRLYTSAQQRILGLIRGNLTALGPPVERMDGLWSPHERAQVEQMTRYAAVGSPTTVRMALERMILETEADEVIITGDVFDHSARVHSFELAAGVMAEINAAG